MPLCDICQECRALLFCQQDRAVLCRDRDPQIHHAELMQKHNRFLLAGIELSKMATVSSTSTITTKITTISNPVNEQHDYLHPFTSNLENVVPPEISSQSLSKVAPECNKTGNDMNNRIMDYYGSSTSTISEYLTEILPGWKVEDLLNSIASPPSLSEHMDDDALPPMDLEPHGRVSSSANNGLQVPDSATFYFQALPGKKDLDLRRKINTKKVIGTSQMKSSVFQKSALYVGFKRKRYLW